MFERGTIQVAQSYENPWWKTNKVDLGLWNNFAINGFSQSGEHKETIKRILPNILDTNTIYR